MMKLMNLMKLMLVVAMLAVGMLAVAVPAMAQNFSDSSFTFEPATPQVDCYYIPVLYEWWCTDGTHHF